MHLKNIIIDNGGVLSSPKTGNWFITTNFWIIINIDDRSVILDEATNCGFNVLLMDRKCECNDSKYNIIHELSEIESVADNI